MHDAPIKEIGDGRKANVRVWAHVHAVSCKELHWPHLIKENERTDQLSPGGVVGAGFDEFRWPRPVIPGDELHIESEVLEVRPSRSRSNQGLIKVRTTTLNQNDEAVQVQIANLIVPRRQSADVDG
jgi:acyl dehydratase